MPPEGEPDPPPPPGPPLVPPGGPPSAGPPPAPAFDPHLSSGLSPDVSHERPPSRALAGWALGLSLLICVPFVPVVGFVLGIVAVARHWRSRGEGWSLAWGAVIIGGTMTIVTIVGLVMGVVEAIREGVDETTRNESGEVIAGGDVEPNNLRVGDCFNDEALLAVEEGEEGETTTWVEVVPCGEPHAFETFAVLEVPGAGDGDDFPGDEAVARQESECYREFTQYVGRRFAASGLEVFLYHPTRMSWRFGDRTLICVVADPRDRQLTGSLEDSRR